MSDTVGFIRKLPHRLIESFKSTLDEVRESDVLVHVVDVTHPRFEDHMRVVNETLEELDANDLPTLVVFNKIDALEERDLLQMLRREYPDASFVSALRGIGLEDMKQDLLALIEKDFVERVAYVPVTAPKAISSIHRLADVVSEDYMYARNGDDSAAPQAVARMRFRVAKRNDQRIGRMLEDFAELKPVSQDASVAD
jgi:GTP-binding protein HflX